MREPARRARWSYLFFWAPPPIALSAREWRVLGLLGVTFLLNQYDMAILGLALPQIQAGLGVPEEGLGGMMAVIRLGVLPAFVLCVMADRVGRRRLLIATILGFAICTGATAFATSATTFAAWQLSARCFIAAEEMLAIVVVAEELDYRVRGWGLGVLATFGALGHGAAALLFGFVAELPFGWRALYALGVLPILIIAYVRRALPETERFERSSHLRATSALEPLRRAVADYPGRLAALSAAVFPFAFVVVPALSFVSKTLQDDHGYAPGHITVLFLAGGTLAILGYAVAGSLADRFGRRRTLVCGLVLNALGIWVFYHAAGPVIVGAWVFMMFGFMGADMLFGALGTELFPTSYRSTASGIRAAVLTAGSAAGLAFEGWLYPIAGSHATALSWMLAASLIAPVVIALAVPETGRRDLDEISPERRQNGLEDTWAEPHPSAGS